VVAVVLYFLIKQLKSVIKQALDLKEAVIFYLMKSSVKVYYQLIRAKACSLLGQRFILLIAMEHYFKVIMFIPFITKELIYTLEAL
jgi:hypothetical protein